MQTGYDVCHLTPAGPDTFHHDGPMETDGPWLILWPVGREPKDGQTPTHLLPSHAVVSVQVCDVPDCGGRSRREGSS